jgi:hypothetical protein
MATLTVSSLPGSTAIAPHLSRMLFTCREDNYIDYTAYLKMVESRWQAADYALKNAALFTVSGPGPDTATLLRLHTLREEGLYFLHLEGPAAFKEMCASEYSASWMH